MSQLYVLLIDGERKVARRGEILHLVYENGKRTWKVVFKDDKGEHQALEPHDIVEIGVV